MKTNNLKTLPDEMFMYENKHNLDNILNKRIKLINEMPILLTSTPIAPTLKSNLWVKV